MRLSKFCDRCALLELDDICGANRENVGLDSFIRSCFLYWVTWLYSKRQDILLLTSIISFEACFYCYSVCSLPYARVLPLTLHLITS